MNKNCIICNKEFSRGKIAIIQWAKAKYCSHACRKKQVNKVCKICLAPFIVAIYRQDTAFYCSPRCRGRGLDNKGEKAYQWKGDRVGYFGLHNWVSKTLGKPKKCEFCLSITKSRYEWANVSKEYKRIKEDWIRLCTSCHQIYDNTGRKTWETRRKRYGVNGRSISI